MLRIGLRPPRALPSRAFRPLSTHCTVVKPFLPRSKADQTRASLQPCCIAASVSSGKRNDDAAVHGEPLVAQFDVDADEAAQKGKELQSAAAAASAGHDAAAAAATKPKQRRKPMSEETRRKISETMKKRAAQLSPEHRRRISAAKMGKPHRISTRYLMHLSRKGHGHDPETRQKISRGLKEHHARRKAASRQKQGAGGATAARPFLAATQHMTADSGGPKSGGSMRGAGLVIEKAVAEMMQLRQEIASFMAKYEKEHGVKPALQDTAESSPELYSKFVRFVALQDYVRNFENQLGTG